MVSDHPAGQSLWARFAYGRSHKHDRWSQCIPPAEGTDKHAFENSISELHNAIRTKTHYSGDNKESTYYLAFDGERWFHARHGAMADLMTQQMPGFEHPYPLDFDMQGGRPMPPTIGFVSQGSELPASIPSLPDPYIALEYKEIYHDRFNKSTGISDADSKFLPPPASAGMYQVPENIHAAAAEISSKGEPAIFYSKDGTDWQNITKDSRYKGYQPPKAATTTSPPSPAAQMGDAASNAASAMQEAKSSGAWSGIVDGLKNNKGAAIGTAAVAAALIGGAALYARHRKQKQQEEAQKLQR